MKKLYVHFEGTPDFTHKQPIDDQCNSIQQIHQNFIKAYNQKFGTQKVLREEYTELLTSSRKLLHLADFSKLEDGGDIYLVEKAGAKKKCTRNGCEKEYTEETNEDNCCSFHPGVAVFHEGLKGWSCCSKKVISFEDFMKIPGCATAKHSDVDNRPKETPKIVASDVKAVSTNASGAEVFKTSEQPLTKGYTNVPIKKDVEKAVEADPLEEEDPPGATIAIGTACLHRGCNYKYENDSSRTNECVYHLGIPLFHEGSKGWTCCRRKVLEFDEFMKIGGCKNGKHKFVPPKKQQEEQVQCRYEFYQSASTVTIAVYAKDVVKEESKVEFGPRLVSIQLKFKDGRKFSKEIQLFELIIPEQSKANFLSVKVEITLKKGNGASWTKLEN